MSSILPSVNIKDETELLYTTLVGMVMAAIFAAGFHDDLEKTVTDLAPEGAHYPFPPQTRPSAAKLASAIAGFLLGVFFWTAICWLRWSLVRKLLAYRAWLIHPRAFKSKIWALSLKLLYPRKKYLHTFQHVLPNYPLPALSDTCKRFLQAVEPLVSEKEFLTIKKEMHEFEKGEGPVLQKILEKRFREEENWLSDLWDKFAYLSQRTPLVVNTNIGSDSALDKSDLAPCKNIKQSARAACMVYHHIKFWEMIKNGTAPAILVLDLVPICSSRYRYLMGCTRIPGMQFDKLKLYEDSRHIVVFRKGLMYRVDMYGLTPSGEERLIPMQEIQSQIEKILKETRDVKETKPNPALFTAQNRTAWAKEREKLLANKLNAASLREAESAILHVVLEETSPKNLSEEAWENLCTRDYNRWCDKSIVINVYENGLCGLQAEHSTADATLHGRMLEYVWGAAEFDSAGNALSPLNDSFASVYSTSPQKIEWDLSEFSDVIPVYEEKIEKLCNNLEMIVSVLLQGKGDIKKCKVSPDGFMQMALQLAYYRMHNSTPKTYESASTRFFKYGRTETIRPVSKYSVAFTKKMDDLNVPRSEVISLLKQAISYQTRYKLDAMNGEASDRHMFGLYVASKMAGLQPKLFEQKMFWSPDLLSTSQSPYSFDKHITKKMSCFPSGGSFGPQRPDGYGVYYLFLEDNQMTLHVTSFRSCPETDSEKMMEEIVKAINDMLDLFKQ